MSFFSIVVLDGPFKRFTFMLSFLVLFEVLFEDSISFVFEISPSKFSLETWEVIGDEENVIIVTLSDTNSKMEYTV